MEPHVQLPPDEKGPWDAVKNPRVIGGIVLLLVIFLGGVTTLFHTFFSVKQETAQEKAERQERAKYESTVPPNPVDVNQFGQNTEKNAAAIAQQSANAKNLSNLLNGAGGTLNAANPLAVPGNPLNADPKVYKAWADADAQTRLLGSNAPGNPYSSTATPGGSNDAQNPNNGVSAAEQKRLDAQKREQERREASMLVIDFTKPDDKPTAKETASTQSAVPAAGATAAPPLPAPVTETAKQEPFPLEEHFCHELCEGDHLDTVLVNNLDGAAPGNVDVEVYEPFFSHDSDPQGRRLLVPVGSRVMGEVFSVGQQNQERLYVAFHKLRRPDGSTFKLENLKGLDQTGAVGLRDKVNNHIVSKIAVAGGIAALGTLTQLNNVSAYGGLGGYDWGVQMRNGLTSQIGQEGMQIFHQKLQQLPSIQARGGKVVVKVYLSGDYSISEFHAAPASSSRAR